MESRITVRVNEDTVRKLDKLAERESKRLAKGSRPVTRSEALRIAIERGIENLNKSKRSA